MQVFTGRTAFPGIAVGKLLERSGRPLSVRRMHITDTERELSRLEKVRFQLSAELAALSGQAREAAGESAAAIFEAQQRLLFDENFLESIRSIVRTEQVDAAYAASVAGDNFTLMFSEMEDPYLRSRASDVRELSDRLSELLAPNGPELEEPALSAKKARESLILAADRLCPAELLRLPRDLVTAIALRCCAACSHTAILAGLLGIPAVYGIDFEAGIDGKQAILDGEAGKLFVDPDPKTLEAYREKFDEERTEKKAASVFQPAVTRSGKRVTLLSNAAGLSDIGLALSAGAEGIGLFRSECLVLGRNDWPSEEEQFLLYKTAIQNMGGRPVVIRSFDLGADKQAAFFPAEREDNPALGNRGIRFCLSHPGLFRAQLRAIFRAAAYGKAAILYPMIAVREELLAARRIAEDVKAELSGKGIPFSGELEQGIMIETPAAAVTADLLAKDADFFSIGTNDLWQYTMAADRQDEGLAARYTEAPEAVLRLTEDVIHAAGKAGIPVTICGELGGDPALSERWLRAGVDGLSAAPGRLKALRETIRALE